MENDASKVLKNKAAKKRAPIVQSVFNVETRSFSSGGFDLKKLQGELKTMRFMNKGDHPLVIGFSEKDPGEYAVLSKFGTVTFWITKSGKPGYLSEVEKAKNSMLELIAPFIKGTKD